LKTIVSGEIPAKGEFVWALLKRRGKSVCPCVEPKRRDEY